MAGTLAQLLDPGASFIAAGLFVARLVCLELVVP
jgi:hypothetical protein